LEQLPVDLIELFQERFQLFVASGEPFNQGKHVFGNVPGPGFSIDLGSKVESGVLEAFGGDGAHQKVEVIDDLLGEALFARLEHDEARHKPALEKDRRRNTPTISQKMPR